MATTEVVKTKTEDAKTVTESPQHAQEAVSQLPNHKVKIKKPLQRACNQKDEKNKLCGGHLKRWFYLADVVEQKCGDVAKAWGPDAEVYRCEHCKTLYLPNPADPRGQNVAGKGMLSVFGLTVAPKEPAKPAAPAAAKPAAPAPAAAPKPVEAAEEAAPKAEAPAATPAAAAPKPAEPAASTELKDAPKPTS